MTDDEMFEGLTENMKDTPDHVKGQLKDLFDGGPLKVCTLMLAVMKDEGISREQAISVATRMTMILSIGEDPGKVGE